MTDKSTHGCLCGKTTFINPHWGKQDKKLKRYRLIERLIIISEPVKLKYQYKFKNRKKSWSVEAFLIAIARIISLHGNFVTRYAGNKTFTDPKIALQLTNSELKSVLNKYDHRTKVRTLRSRKITPSWNRSTANCEARLNQTWSSSYSS